MKVAPSMGFIPDPHFYIRLAILIVFIAATIPAIRGPITQLADINTVLGIVTFAMKLFMSSGGWFTWGRSWYLIVITIIIIIT